MNAWPDTLPRPTMAFSNEVEGSAIRTKTEFGRYRSRARFMRQNRMMKVTFEMTDEQRTIFADFWKDDISNGADWFEMELPLTEGVTTHKVRFSAVSYAESHKAILNWNISATLETDSKIAPLTAEEVDAFLLFDTFDEFHEAVLATEAAVALILE